MIMTMIEERTMRGMEIPRITLPIRPIRACGLFGNVAIKSGPRLPTIISAESESVFIELTLKPKKTLYNFKVKFSPDFLKEIPLQRKRLEILDLGETLELRTGHLMGEVDRLTGEKQRPYGKGFVLDFNELNKIHRALRYLKYDEKTKIVPDTWGFSFSIQTRFGHCACSYYPLGEVEKQEVKNVKERF